MALPTEIDSVGLAIMRQIKQERDVQTVDMAGIETWLEDAMLKRMNQMEQRLEQVARQGRKERTDLVVSALTSSIIQRMEQVVRQELKSMLPGLVTRT